MFGKKVPTPAVIIAEEDYGMVDKSAKWTLQHQTYIIEVHPEGEPAFRTEVTAWVTWPGMPKKGDKVTVLHHQGSQKVEFHVEGDPRFTWKLRKAAADQHNTATRQELLKMPSQDTTGHQGHHHP